MKHLFALTLITLSTAMTTASAIERCDQHSNTLYKEIQIYKRTARILPEYPQIGEVLEANLKMIDSRLTERQKIQALETGFAKCDPVLSERDQLDIDIATETLLKMRNPLITD